MKGSLPGAIRGGTASAMFVCACALAAPSCATVIGVEDYEDAVEELCKCPALSEVDDCAKLASDRLADDQAKRSKWIKGFSDSCLCDRAGECFDRSPTCTAKNGKCSSSAECCGHSRSPAGCCTNLKGPYCCERCATCNEVLGSDGSPGVPTCLESQKLVEALLKCACDACPSCQNAGLCGGNEEPTALCAGCFTNKVQPEQQCGEEAAACVTDKPEQ